MAPCHAAVLICFLPNGGTQQGLAAGSPLPSTEGLLHTPESSLVVTSSNLGCPFMGLEGAGISPS